jgi:hypothetical protein
MVNNKALLLEVLLSGFFAVACIRARGSGVEAVALAPRDFLRLTDRLERLRRTRWQWFSMVLVIVLVRLQSGLPLVVELTALAQFVTFLALPTQGHREDQLLRAGSASRLRRPMGNAT